MKAWPCEVTSHGLRSSGAEGEYAVAAFMAKSSLTLRGPTTGMSPTLTEVRFLVAEHSNGRIWAGGIHHIALWYVCFGNFQNLGCEWIIISHITCSPISLCR